MIHAHFDNKAHMTVQAQGLKMNDYLTRKLDGMFTALTALTDDIVKIEVSIEESGHKLTSPRKIAVNVQLAGADVRASDSGKQWKSLIRHVQQRLQRQIEKRKELQKRQLMLHSADTSRQRA